MNSIGANIDIVLCSPCLPYLTDSGTEVGLLQESTTFSSCLKEICQQIVFPQPLQVKFGQAKESEPDSGGISLVSQEPVPDSAYREPVCKDSEDNQGSENRFMYISPKGGSPGIEIPIQQESEELTIRRVLSGEWLDIVRPEEDEINEDEAILFNLPIVPILSTKEDNQGVYDIRAVIKTNTENQEPPKKSARYDNLDVPQQPVQVHPGNNDRGVTYQSVQIDVQTRQALSAQEPVLIQAREPVQIHAQTRQALPAQEPVQTHAGDNQPVQIQTHEPARMAGIQTQKPVQIDVQTNVQTKQASSAQEPVLIHPRDNQPVQIQAHEPARMAGIQTQKPVQIDLQTKQALFVQEPQEPLQVKVTQLVQETGVKLPEYTQLINHMYQRPVINDNIELNQIVTTENPSESPEKPQTLPMFINETNVAAVETAQGFVPKSAVAVQLTQAIVEQITLMNVRTEATAVTQFEITLNPEHLGKVEIKLIADGMKMSVLIITESDSVRDLLLSRMQSVRVLVELTGVTVERYEVVSTQQSETLSVKVEQDFLDKENGSNQQNAHQEQGETEQDEAEVNFAELMQQFTVI
jgi:flagellar hook-length control protein FliK